jgi:hypothetical protein
MYQPIFKLSLYRLRRSSDPLSSIVLCHYTTQQHFQYPVRRQPGPLLTLPRHGIDHVSNTVLLTQCIVQLLQVLGCFLLVADLEELDADLSWLCAPCVKFAGGRNYNALNIVNRFDTKTPQQRIFIWLSLDLASDSISSQHETVCGDMDIHAEIILASA